MENKTIQLLLALTVLAACGESKVTLGSRLRYDQSAQKLMVELTRDLKSGEDLHVRVRSLAEGNELDCATAGSSIQVYEQKNAGGYVGPSVTPSMFEPQTSPDTLLGETEESFQRRLENTYFVDLCIMNGAKVAHQARYDLMQALDSDDDGGPKADNFDDGERIASNQKYAEACIESMGDIPFWTRTSPDALDWNTVDCTQIGTPIPSEVNGVPSAEHRAAECDNPQQIYSHCEADARTGANGPRVAVAKNDQGTEWVLLCRKSHRAVGRYEDMAMIGHNPFTGKTCFFQNQLPFGETPVSANDGTRIPHPADDVSSTESPETWTSMWGRIEGGIGPTGGIQCAGCHSTDPFIHSPWIDGAKDANGKSLVPKMGEHPDFVTGYNAPYTLVDGVDQGWTMPKHLVSPEASSCTSCHRIGRDQWTSSALHPARSTPEGGCVFCGQAPWLNRLEGKDNTWERLVTESHRDFKNVYWMPPNASEVLDQTSWETSAFKASMDFVKRCGENPDDAACQWADLPKTPGDPSELPAVEAEGIELAQAALNVIGAKYTAPGGETIEGTRRCSECHSITKNGLRNWLSLTEQANELGVDGQGDFAAWTQEMAMEVVNNMRRDQENADTVFAAAHVGIYAAGVQFGWFQKLFQLAYGNNWGQPYGAFLSRVSMPKGSHPPMSAPEYATVMKWFNEGDFDSDLDTLMPDAPRPATCEAVRAEYGLNEPNAWLTSHVDEMAFDGWGARNRENGISMYGCSSANPLDCFSEGFTEQPTWLAEGVTRSRLVTVREFGFSTSYWMRTSADGRFVGNGGGDEDSDLGATITDLVTSTNIPVRGSYDPGFFPNNDGFIMQGGGAGLCGQSVLTRMDAIMDGIDFTEAGCTTASGINLYQHVAVNLDGGDYFVINSEFTSDSGQDSNDPFAGFGADSTMKFSPLLFDGSTWTQKPAVVVNSPYEGDSVLSPSGRLVISRFAGPAGASLGYMLRRVESTPTADGYTISVDQPVQFVCTPGAKANISFDERYSVTHHYENETANLYVTDLLSGVTTKITNMPADTYAQFPHFRSDGWIYFLVKGPNGDVAMASNAALVLAAATR